MILLLLSAAFYLGARLCLLAFNVVDTRRHPLLTLLSWLLAALLCSIGCVGFGVWFCVSLLP